jgi:hypothetical protein
MIRVAITCTPLLCCLLLSTTLVAQDGAPVETTTPGESLQPLQPGQAMTSQEKLNALALKAAEALKPLPDGEQRQLKTVIMTAQGKAQWRAKGSKKWTTAKQDQVLQAGTQIRTGRSSKLVLRVGLNATVLIDALARVTLPTVLQHGKTLTTTLQIDRGRADIKVGHVGLTNDFTVLTPSGALAVKGTSFAVSHNALKGTQIVSARTNAIRAIEVSYHGSKLKQFLDASSVSTQETPNPANAAAFASAGPAPLVASESIEQQDAESATTEAVIGSNPVQGSTRTLIAAQQETNNEEAIDDIPLPPDYPQNLAGWSDYFQNTVYQEDDGALAAAIYFDVKLQSLPPESGSTTELARRVPAAFENNLFASTAWNDPSRDQYIEHVGDQTILNVPWGADLPDATTGALGAAYQSIIDYGDNIEENYPDYPGSSADLNNLLQYMNDFCVITFQVDGNNVDLCRDAYANALNSTLYDPTGFTAYAWALEHAGHDHNGNEGHSDDH